jgi:hypothetical protein
MTANMSQMTGRFDYGDADAEGKPLLQIVNQDIRITDGSQYNNGSIKNTESVQRLIIQKNEILKLNQEEMLLK